MLELTLLGPVEILVDGHPVPLPPLERNLLALLALSADAVVSTERIIDGLWGDRTPVAPRARVQGLVSGLRRKMGGALITRNPGYVLTEISSDLDRCEQLIRQAQRASDAAEKADLLRDAGKLWRGEPLDGVSAPGTAASRVRLAELRTSLAEEHFDAEFALGRHAEVVRELFALVAVHPLRERLTGQLMLALYHSNRRAEALAAYANLRNRLAEELGTDPCPDLRDLQRSILRGDTLALSAPETIAIGAVSPRQEARPAQIPASVGHFHGRDDELATLTAALPAPGDEPVVLLISGAGGLGKTALAVRWAHAVTDRFPDGQIFVDLRGSRADSLSPRDALSAVLLTLGLAPDRLPASTEERVAQFRTMVHGLRILLLADDAGAIEQLLPLVPPTSGSVIVATSRGRLTALRAYHAVRTLIVEPLPEASSFALLDAIVGAERFRGAGAAELVRLCGGWPLTIRLVGATLAARTGQSLTSFAAELSECVDVLAVAGDPRTVRSALAATLHGVDPAAARLFAQLGLLPVAKIGLDLATATAGVSLPRARRLMDELVSANLVAEAGTDRYRCHDIIWQYARRCGAALSDRHVVEDRVTRWYLTAADSLGADAAAVIHWVAARGNPAHTWQLVATAHAAGATLPPSTYELGLVAAKQLGDRRCLGEAHAYLGLAQAPDTAHLTEAIDLLEGGPVAGAAAFALGVLRSHQGRPAEGSEAIDWALTQLDPLREPISYAIALAAHAEVLDHLGAADLAQIRFAQALILCAANASERFHTDYAASFALDEFLRYVRRCLAAPKVTAADRLLAQRLLQTCHTADVGQDPLLALAVAGPGLAVAAT